MSDAASDSSASILLARDRLAIVGAPCGVTALAWAYLWIEAARMQDMHGGMAHGIVAAAFEPWSAARFAMMLAMWWVMMIGMMLPSAMPIVLTFATVNRRKRALGRPYVPTAFFTAGYLIAWGAFSVLATTAQFLMERAALMTPAMALSSATFGGLLFLGAGLYQFTPAKYACLDKCRSPLDFVLNNWREGALGATSTGLRYGFFCLGCCWAVMLLMFVGGTMNLVWGAAMAVFVLVEKLGVAGQWVARGSGAAMVVAGVYLLAPAW